MRAEDEQRETEPVITGDLAEPESPSIDDYGNDPAGDPEAEKWKKLALSYKSKVEDENRASRQLEDLRAENELLKERSQPSPAVEDAGQRTRLQEILEKAQALADSGDAAAALVLTERAERLQSQARLERGLNNWVDAQEIDDRSERERVLKEFRSGNYATMEAARKAVKGENLEARLKEAEQKLASYERQKPPKDVIRTVHREAAAGTTTTMTRALWLERQEALPDEERRREQRLRINGKIVVKN